MLSELNLRWNILALFAGLLFVTVFVVGGVFAGLDALGLVNEDTQEMVLVGLFGLASATVSGVVAYTMGVMQALTSSSPTVTEDAHLEALAMMQGSKAPSDVRSSTTTVRALKAPADG